jgi:hypothetical protein
MQDRTWTFTAGDGQTRGGFSSADAAKAIRRAMHGQSPFAEKATSERPRKA